MHTPSTLALKMKVHDIVENVDHYIESATLGTG